MAKLTTDELLDAFKEMTLIELSEFVKQFDEIHGSTAAAPVAVAAAPSAAGGDSGAVDVDQDAFDVILEATGDKRIQVIKEVRSLTSLGLKQAFDLVGAAPSPVLRGVAKDAADRAKEALEGTGATVTVLVGASSEVGTGLQKRMQQRPEFQGPNKTVHPLEGLNSAMATPDNADLVRALTSNVRRWIEWLGAPGVSQESATTSLGGLTEVASAFVELWDADLFADWFFEPSPHLDGGSPADLVELGDSPTVVAALGDAAYGVYA